MGHDHVNNYAFTYDDVMLTYGLKTGEDSYHEDYMNGGTLIHIDGDTGEFTIEHIFVDLDEVEDAKGIDRSLLQHSHSHEDEGHGHYHDDGSYHVH